MSGEGASAATAAPFIPRVGTAARNADPLSYASLRSHAIERAQAASGQVWTDYNLHDPGVTLLEAVCYALTELAYKIDFDVADHLCDPDGRLDFERLALFEPHEIFPCRATTTDDLRRVLLDRVDLLHDVSLRAEAGLYSARLLPVDGAEGDWEQLAAAVRRAYRGQRLLGEDLDERLAPIKIEWCSLHLTAALDGPRPAEDVLAEIFEVCATAFSPTPRFRSFEALRAAGWSLEQIFTGPPTRSGVLDDAAGPEPSDRRALNVIELRRRVAAIDGVAAVERIALQSDEGLHTRALAWSADMVSPRLRTPSRNRGASPANLDLGQIKLHRRGSELQIDPGELAARYADRRAGHGRRPLETAPDQSLLPRGAPRAAAPYCSVRYHFPPLYGLGDGAIPDGADPSRVAQAEQFKAYLALFDRLLANGAAQLDHMGELLSPDGDLDRSYWFGALDDRAAPGVERLYGGKSPEQVRRKAFDPYDDASDRRGRALDHVLAMYGEAVDGSSLRQFLDYLDRSERARLLVETKAAFLRQVVTLGRDRAGGFDYGEPLWAGEDRTPGLHKRIALLIGFQRPRARSLIGALSHDHETDDRARPRAPMGAGMGAGMTAPLGLAPAARIERDTPRALQWPDEDGPPVGEREAARLLLGRRTAATAPLLRLGAYRRRYAWRPDVAGRGGRLFLGPDESGAWRDLGWFADEAQAGRMAVWLRRRVLAVSEACEGLHIVEHNLLRPRTPSPSGNPRGGLCATFVFPNWTARTARPDFQRFVEQTVTAQCPAHVDADCLWLDMRQMALFEQAYGVWLERLRAHSAGPGGEAALDAAAAALWAVMQASAAAAPRSGG